MKKGTAFLLVTTFLFLGMIIGFLMAPIKNGISIGNKFDDKIPK
jgi:hypothetical protein